jgi:hypothetical protein
VDIDTSNSRTFFIVPARNRKGVAEKISELQEIGVPFIIVCGEKINHPNVVYRENNGKWDAINFGSSFVPKNARVIALNDVDTKIHNFENALSDLNSDVCLVYCKVQVPGGPQVKFYAILNPLRSRFHIAASGELIVMRSAIFRMILPLPPCVAEDSYILFKTLELGYRADFCTGAYVTTERTRNTREEVAYKKRTTLGIYQALDYSKPPPMIRVFYFALPLLSPLLFLAGKDGKAWMNGIGRAFRDHIANKSPTKF